jgi:hypothetical protein
VSRCHRCDFRGIDEIVPPPDNVEIGAQQNQVEAIYVSGRMIRDFNCIHAGAVYWAIATSGVNADFANSSAKRILLSVSS